MGGYLVNFSVYTFAMVGFLFIAVAVYKKTSVAAGNSNKEGEMIIENSLSLSPRKRLHVVRVNGEKFLIAADVERTEFLAKLDSQETFAPKNNVISLNKHPELMSKPENLTQNFQIQGNAALKPVYKTRLSQVKNVGLKKPPVMREILRKLEITKG